MPDDQSMRSAGPWRRLFTSDHLVVGDYRCAQRHVAAGREEYSRSTDIVFIRRGMFIRHRGREQHVADANHALLFNEGEAYRVSHPVCTGDRCTTLTVDQATLREAQAELEPRALDADRHAFGLPATAIGSQAVLLHSQVFQSLAFQQAESMEVEEACYALLAHVLRQVHRPRDRRRPVARVSTANVHRDLVEATKVELSRHTRDGITLPGLARRVHSSSFHLARVFRRVTGVTIHRYLTRLRLADALDHLAGDTKLTRVALASGFFDHSHFSNSFRREFGASPSACRDGAGAAPKRWSEMSRLLQAAREA